MSETVKAAIIIAAAIVIGVALWVYFSPYQSCVRAGHAKRDTAAENRCAMLLSGYRP